MSATLILLLFSAAVCVLGLGLRVSAVLSRTPKGDPLRPRGSATQGVRYAFTSGMLPWNKESGRIHKVPFWLGVTFHLGIAASLVVLLLRLTGSDDLFTVARWFALPSVFGALFGAYGFWKRVTDPHMRRLSVPDDFISTGLTVLFCATAVLATWGAFDVALFDVSAAALLLYVPFSKIRHMMTFFISKYYHGKHLGLIGIYGPDRERLFGELEAGVPVAGADGEAEPADGTRAEIWEDGRSLELSYTDEELENLQSALGDAMDRQAVAMMDACVHCGVCAEACHYYVATGDRAVIPAEKLHKAARVFRHQNELGGNLLAPLTGAASLDSDSANDLLQGAYEQCTLCGRCGLSCPMGINTGHVMGHVRRAFAKAGKTPPGLDNPAKTAVEKGNYLGLPNDEVVETIEWLAEELADELEVDEVEIPIDVEGAEILFVPHPLELRDFPMAVMAAAKIFHRAGANYTFSSEHFDTVNYAYYGGNDELMTAIIEHLAETAEKLGVKRVVLSPCGHGYKVLRWDAERILGKPFDFEVVSLAELLAEYVREGKLSINEDSLSGTVTYHDSCNMARNAGVIEEPRQVLRAVTDEYVEMLPGGAWNYCCGGGGGLSATGEFGKTRLIAGQAKARQIQATGAKTVVTNCFNCNTQLKELDRKHKLGIDVKSIHAVVADALD